MRSMTDAALSTTKALPAGATSQTSDPIDVGLQTRGTRPAQAELLLSYPALSLAQLPNTKTMTYELLSSPNADMSNPTGQGILATQTGATGTDPCGRSCRRRRRYKPDSPTRQAPDWNHATTAIHHQG